MPKRKRKNGESPNGNNVSDHDDEEPKVVNAPTPSNKMIERQVDLLLEKDSVSTILDTFLKLHLHQRKNLELCKAFEHTDISENLIKALSEANETKAGDIAEKILNLKGRNTHPHENMKEFMENEKLQEYGCCALNNLSLTAFREKLIIDHFNDDDLFIVISEVMKKYLSSMYIQKAITRCLYRIVCQEDNQEINEKIIRNGFVESIMINLDKRLENDDEDDDAYKWSCYVLEKLVENDEVKQRILAKDGTVILARVENFHRKKSNHDIATLAYKLIGIVCNYKNDDD